MRLNFLGKNKLKMNLMAVYWNGHHTPAAILSPDGISFSSSSLQEWWLPGTSSISSDMGLVRVFGASLVLEESRSSTDLTKPSRLGFTSVTRPKGHRLRGTCLSLIRTASLTWMQVLLTFHLWHTLRLWRCLSRFLVQNCWSRYWTRRSLRRSMQSICSVTTSLSSRGVRSTDGVSGAGASGSLETVWLNMSSMAASLSRARGNIFVLWLLLSGPR